MAGNEERRVRHLAVIMDGNGRWAKKRGLERIEGHRQGAEAVRRILSLSLEFGIEYLTLYAFSTENWKRPAEEVDALMHLLKMFLEEHLADLQEKKIRLRAIGRLDLLPAETLAELHRAMEATAGNRAGTLVLALNYGGRAEIVDAAAKIAADAAAGKLIPSQLDEKAFKEYLYAPDLPDPDLMIRTSGEMRLSNFLLWQLSYAELYVTETLWPDFGREEMEKAFNSFHRRKRRYGGVTG